jgi:hypothetical protein
VLRGLSFFTGAMATWHSSNEVYIGECWRAWPLRLDDAGSVTRFRTSRWLAVTVESGAMEKILKLLLISLLEQDDSVVCSSSVLLQY